MVGESRRKKVNGEGKVKIVNKEREWKRERPTSRNREKGKSNEKREEKQGQDNIVKICLYCRYTKQGFKSK